MAAAPRWLALESNPEVMNKFIHSLGVPETWKLIDVLGLDPELLQMVPQPVLALILLYPASVKGDKDQEAAGDSGSESVYYMKQTIRNACGTIALLHAIGNNVDKLGLEGGYLKDFFDATKDLSPAERGAKLEEDETIMKAHAKTAQEGQTVTPNLEDDVDNHFAAFVEVGGTLYELDGSKSAAINHGSTSPDTLLADSAVACKKFMERDPNEVRFTMIALAAASD